ncbi:ATPase family AAA domain-containing protein 5b isoform X2 [Mugil cephalus]|uniref:ATPase family AAA domain-containing protein 5b isoform X2 n=1 Tax=Mugil cephalus TaxID=48193 RepID=UPI001FB78027|nr:ATPase family AAA domain-containing protein 5b isoform X2 [Mugil cephalus]
MRTKRKGRTNVTERQRKGQAQPTEVIVLDSSPSEMSAAKDEDCSNATVGFSKRDAKHLQAKGLCAKGNKVAPIFLRAIQHSKSKGSSGGEQVIERRTQSKDVQDAMTPPAECKLPVNRDSILSPRRGQLSPSSLHSSLEEIQTFNPAFPVRTVFKILETKASESVLESSSTELSSNPSSLQNKKRKQGNEISDRVPKRMRTSPNAEGAGHLSGHDVQDVIVLPVKKHPRSTKLSRSYRLERQSGNPVDLPNTCSPKSVWTNTTTTTSTTSDAPLLQDSGNLQRVSCFEDVLWTDKYRPQHSSEVIGNSDSVNKLHSWLKTWKLRANCDERRKMEEVEREENTNDSWDWGDFRGESGSEDEDEQLHNTMLITGPPGVGKTASVYACAQELGFKVFEVNCSSQRSGRHVQSQLMEATQSHLVEMTGKDPLKPAYFTNYITNSCTSKSEPLPGKTVLPKTVTSTSKKRAAKNLSCSSRKIKAKPATLTLAHYFKKKDKADDLQSAGPSPAQEPNVSSSPDCNQIVPQGKKTMTSLILFEEVDVIFDDDVGFLAAIRAFMRTTKRPIILTTNDPSFKDRFGHSLEEIIFKTPCSGSICSYLQLVCLAEQVRMDLDDIGSLVILTCGDIRRCLLQLQLWVCSGGRRASHTRNPPEESICVKNSDASEGDEGSDSQIQTGCSAHMLGLYPVTPNHLVTLLKRQPWSETDMNTLLTQSWRRGVPLLYSNLELLLSLEINKTSVHNLQSQPPTSKSDHPVQQQNHIISPNVLVPNHKSARNVLKLSRRKRTTSSTSSLTPKHQTSLDETHLRAMTTSDKPGQYAVKMESACLDALADFFDLMSYHDSTLPAADPCTPEAFVWTGAEFKDSFMDEMSKEEGRSWGQERLMDIQAAVEGLGCHKCWRRVSEAWTEVQKLGKEPKDKWWGRLASTASSKRQSLSFSYQHLCTPSAAQQRYELSRTVLSSKSFSLLGNRQAVSVDYMPVLRSICRSNTAQQQKRRPARRLNYLSSTNMDLSKSTILLLAEDFTGT